MRVCRVRESELSLLTNEADKFMFPRISSEVATDEDRQSTSEHADISVDLPSSDAFDHRTGGRSNNRTMSHHNTPSDQSYLSNAATPRDLDASNKRKRRKQLEAFLNDNSEYYKFDKPESRLRFQEAPFQPSLMCPTTTDGGHHNRSSTTSHTMTQRQQQESASSSSELCSSGRGIAIGPSLSMMCSSTASTSSSPWASPLSSPSRNALSRQSKLHQLLSNPPSNSEGTTTTKVAKTGTRDTEDRKGASPGTSATHQMNSKTYDKGHLLRTDVVKMHKFAFERVPSSEPWYEAFQRQDECRERVFEYWGSTG